MEPVWCTITTFDHKACSRNKSLFDVTSFSMAFTIVAWMHVLIHLVVTVCTPPVFQCLHSCMLEMGVGHWCKPAKTSNGTR